MAKRQFRQSSTQPFLSSAVGDDLGIAMSFFFFGPRVVIENGRDTPFLLSCSSYSHREKEKNIFVLLCSRAHGWGVRNLATVGHGIVMSFFVFLVLESS